MQLVFGNTSNLLGKKHKDEAQRCVRLHGSGGKGDEMGARFIIACKTEYVALCVDRELTANPTNSLAQDLKQHFTAVTQ